MIFKTKKMILTYPHFDPDVPLTPHRHPILHFVSIALKGSLTVWNTRLDSFYDARPWKTCVPRTTGS